MTSPSQVQAQVFKYDFAIEIAKSAQRVWPLLINDINHWWSADFRVLGEDSAVSLDPRPGGMLLEEGANGDFLEWYRVQMAQSGKALYLVGDLAPDWGGPSTSMLKLALTDSADGCVLTVSEGLSGCVSEASVQSAEAGWRTLFGECFKQYAQR